MVHESKQLRNRRSKEHVTILCDFNFTTTTSIDDFFQFIDCMDVEFDGLARDIRASVIELQYNKIIIVIGNVAVMDNFTNVVHPVLSLINAIIDRRGCLHIRIWVMNVLPRPGVDPDVTAVIHKQN